MLHELPAAASGAAPASAWAQSLLAVTGVSLLSLVGALTFVVKRATLDRYLPYLVSAAAGALLGSAFFDLIPEVAVDGLTGEDSALLVGGMVLFFAFERYVHWHQHGHAPGHAQVAPYAWMNLAGDGLHNFVDGIVIAAAFVESPALGLSTTLAVAIHEIPQELGDVGVLLAGRLPRGRAILLNLGTALLALVGCVVGLLAGSSVAGFHDVVIAITAGGFLYIAAADLMPELHRHEHGWPSFAQMACLVGGIAVMAAV